MHSAPVGANDDVRSTKADYHYETSARYDPRAKFDCTKVEITINTV